jgi:hypothetical protein
MNIYDKEGVLRDQAWLEAEFGAVVVEAGAGPYQVAELHEADGHSSVIVTVKDANGASVPGVRVAFYWPDAPEEPGSGWHERCVYGDTNESGQIGFGMGPGAYYWPPGGGPHAVWIYGADQSDMISGLGMIGGTNHRHLDVVFQEGGSPPEPPEPPPTEDFETAVLERLDEVIRQLNRIVDLLEAV